MQNIPEYLTQRIFATLAGLNPIEDFEKWLYTQEHLIEKMSEDFYLDLFAFNYKGKDALYEFNALMKVYYGNHAHKKWKVKCWLEKVAKGEKLEEEVLQTFYELWCWDDLEFLKPLGQIFLELDEFWNAPDREHLKEKSRKFAGEILTKLKAEESHQSFKLSEFKYFEPVHAFSKVEPKVAIVETEVVKNATSQKKWWEFWK